MKSRTWTWTQRQKWTPKSRRFGDQPKAKVQKIEKAAQEDGVTLAHMLEETFQHEEMVASIIDTGTSGRDCGYRPRTAQR